MLYERYGNGVTLKPGFEEDAEIEWGRTLERAFRKAGPFSSERG